MAPENLTITMRPGSFEVSGSIEFRYAAIILADVAVADVVDRGDDVFIVKGWSHKFKEAPPSCEDPFPPQVITVHRKTNSQGGIYHEITVELEG